ncbi:amino acid/polyamine transporter I [Xylariaceae sp. FL1019]|nr:amino acid/polyamine transporter I [Xylariaceae sp. FL1019]
MPGSISGSLGTDLQDDETDEHHATVTSELLRRPSRQDLRPSLTLLNGLAIVISLQIGSGIFSAPSLISQHVGSSAEGLIVFIAAGLLVWTGAASFIELGLRVPSNGGIQEYLRASWGDYAGYLFTWIWVGISKPVGNAVISTIFANYLLRSLLSSGPISPWTIKIVALGCVATLTVINCLGATAGAKAANAFLLLKLGALGSIIAIGLVNLISGHGGGVPTSGDGWFGGDRDTPRDDTDIWTWFGEFTTALFAALFCYGGWETAGFIAGDLKDPRKDIPLIINGAMTLVIVGFFLMNVSLYICLPLDVIRESTAVAVEFARRTLGAWGGIVFSIVVAISAMGAVNANMFAVAKLTVVAAQRAYVPPILANSRCETSSDEAAYLRRTWPWPLQVPVQVFARQTRKLRCDQSVPTFALLLHGVLTSLFILVGTFSDLIALLEMTKSFCYMWSVLGLFILRRADGRKSAELQTKYRTWSGNPVIFASVSALLIIRGVLSAPLQASSVVLFAALLGLAVLYRRFGPRSNEISASV